MTLSDIRKLCDTLNPLSMPGGIRIGVRSDCDSLSLTAFPNTEVNREKMRAILKPLCTQFSSIDLILPFKPSVPWEFLNRIDFFNLKDALVKSLRAEIDALSQIPNLEPLYVFLLFVSPDHYGAHVAWNTPSKWAEREAYYAAKGYKLEPFSKYNSAEFSSAITSFEAPWEPVREALVLCEEVWYECCEQAGEHESSHFGRLFENRFRATAIRALKEVIPDLERLPKTSDFVCFVQDDFGDELFLKLETIPEKRLREIMPWLFKNTK